MWCKSDLKIVSTPHGNKKNRATSICRWGKSNLKIKLELKGSTKFDNSWKKNFRFENKVKHLKGIDQSSKGKG